MTKIPLVLLAVSVPLVLAASSRSALAQEKGRFVIDALAAPEPGLGFGYYFTDRLSLSPTLGFGHSSLNGTFYTVGGSLRYYLRPQHRLAPYAEVEAAYVHNQAVPVDASDPSQGFDIESHGARLGLGAGLRYGLNRRLALFGEARLTHATTPVAFGSGTGDWGRIRLSDQDNIVFGLGVTFTLNPRSSTRATLK